LEQESSTEEARKISMHQTPTVEYPLPTGSIFSGYLLQEEIGFNAPNTPIQVHRAQNVETGQVVALKILSLRYGQTHPEEQTVARFKREIEIFQSVVHPHILPILSVGTNARYLWMTSPYCWLGSLADLLEQQQKPLPITQACNYAIQICEALQAAHDHASPIIHRDIKPHNILLQDEHTVLLGDFGIAHIMYGQHLTLTNRLIGSLLYMAPEQFQPKPDDDREYLDTRLDIYALGCVLYEMLSGSPPFTAAIPEAIALAHMRAKPQPLYRRNPRVNKGLWLIVERALEKQPEDRYQSAREFAAALAPFVEE
jgi:serine/threonine protein kinase